MSIRRCWTTLPVLGLTIALGGCGALSPGDGPSTGGLFGGSSLKAEVDFLAVADRLRSGGDCANAALFYRRAYGADPANTVALARLAECLTAVGDNAGAAEAYGRALMIDPDNPGLLRGLGNARILLAQPRLAAPQFEAALRVDPRDVRAYNGLGVALDMTGDHRKAQDAYRAGLAVDPGNRPLLNNLGLSLALAGNESEAMAMLEKLNAAPAATAVNRQNLALVYGLTGRYEAAERLARVDLAPAEVQRNLSFYVSAQGGDPRPALAGALGVALQPHGQQYTTAAPALGDLSPASDDPAHTLASAPSAKSPNPAPLRSDGASPAAESRPLPPPVPSHTTAEAGPPPASLHISPAKPPAAPVSAPTIIPAATSVTPPPVAPPPPAAGPSHVSDMSSPLALAAALPPMAPRDGRALMLKTLASTGGIGAGQTTASGAAAPESSVQLKEPAASPLPAAAQLASSDLVEPPQAPPQAAPISAAQTKMVLPATRIGLQLPQPFPLQLGPSVPRTSAVMGVNPPVIVNLDVLE